MLKYFIVEDRWAQTAGGGYKLHDRRRDMVPIPLKLTNPVEMNGGYFLLALILGKINKFPFTNSFQSGGMIPEHINIAKYYDNQWLYRTVVQLGKELPIVMY